MFGALATIYCNSGHLKTLPIKLKGILAFAGFLLIILSYFLFLSATPHPSLWTIIPVFGTVLIIIFASSQCVTGNVLSLKLMIHVGLISYSLYLWHQPIFVLTKLKTSLLLSPEIQFLLLISTFIIAYVSWRFVEKPFRKTDKFGQTKIFKWSLGSFIGLLSLGLCCSRISSFKNIYIQKIWQGMKYCNRRVTGIITKRIMIMNVNFLTKR
ncbi:acyltransferase family protein [Colwellia hornerae]|uniref:Acyltransferase n=1 Tax=Colwellia hornerae TaxID=89402 RepID=A0A5C6Q2G0_9GAMM|nr:acyltransferase [Colwellia hornerae]TWX52495.1 acyltransferase [Colwellia hornerae]TWX58324.1 acyltransferase [Colwellia hornerae]TWX62736.1 acyltransferase [Colwellia hornerae]